MGHRWRTAWAALTLVLWVAIPARPQGALPSALRAQPQPLSLRAPIQGPASLDLASRYLEAGASYEGRGLVDCVDLYYRSAVVAYACLERANPPPEALALYNEALARCLESASALRRIDPTSRLLVRCPAGMLAVPVLHRGFVWQPQDFNLLVDPQDLKHDPGIERVHWRSGVGATQVVLRNARGDASDAYLMQRHPFAATAVLHPDVKAWFSPQPDQAPGDRLELLDPIRVQGVTIGGRVVTMAADLDSTINMLRFLVHGDQMRYFGLLRPGDSLDKASLYVLEPYQPGKIPVVLVHGLWSSPLTWSDMYGDLVSDPVINDTYQIWFFAYPTGVGFARTASILRESLNAIVPGFDPENQDRELRRIVLVGHSMGGLISKLQTCSSGDVLYSAYSDVPFDDLQLDPNLRENLRRQLFFEPQPYVKRVVFIATPHRGSTMANQLAGRIGSSLIRVPDDTRLAYRELRDSNPGALKRAFSRRPPTSIDLLEMDHPMLLAMLELPHDESAPWHTIAGVGKTRPFSREPTDGVVPLSSARINGVDSEIEVDATHSNIHHKRETVDEVKRILVLHARGEGAGAGTVRHAMTGADDDPVSSQPEERRR